MISRSNRFHGRASLRRMQTTSKSVRGNMLALKYVPNPKRVDYRLAVVVSKKVSKSAVIRNRIRRRIYENVRILSSNFTGPYDLVIIVYDASIAAMSSDELTTQITKLAKKAQLTSA